VREGSGRENAHNNLALIVCRSSPVLRKGSIRNFAPANSPTSSSCCGLSDADDDELSNLFGVARRAKESAAEARGRARVTGRRAAIASFFFVPLYSSRVKLSSWERYIKRTDTKLTNAALPRKQVATGNGGGGMSRLEKRRRSCSRGLGLAV